NHPVAGPRNRINSVGDPLDTRTLRSIARNLNAKAFRRNVSSICVRLKACSHAGQDNQMLALIHTSKPLVGEPPLEFKGSGRDQLADESNTRILLEHPGATLAHAVILQYRPVNSNVLPVFVLLHLLFAPLLWLLLRWPNATLGASFALYVLVHVFGWTVPAWP